MKQTQLKAHEFSGCYVSEYKYKYTVLCVMKQRSLFDGQQRFGEMLFIFLHGR
jgi:hypothetical protein